MNIGVTCTPVKSILDKPLNELTEDDISQLTREDCRRYLKEKGMRRPSWNKSQAIQQVISLKSLLEPSLPRTSLRPPLVRPSTSTTVTSSSSSSLKELSATDVSVVALADDRSLNHLAGPSSSDPVRELECLPVATESKPVPSRSANAPDPLIGKMTIYYGGEVNVYDGVPVDKKAHSENPLQCSSPSHLCASTGQSMLSDADGHANRQVSLQRYYEKRKDRGKFKLKRKIESSSGLEMYLNHQMRMPVASGQPTQSKSNSLEQLGMLNTGHGFVDNQPNNPGLSVDLNDEGGQPLLAA